MTTLRSHERTYLIHSKEWIVLLVFVVGTFFFRVNCAEPRESLGSSILGHEIRNEHDLSLVMVDACRLDVDALCKMPSTFSGLYGKNQVLPNGQPKFFSMVLIQDEPFCNQNLLAPTPFMSMMFPFMHRSCPRKDLHVRESSNSQELLQDIMDLAVEQIFNDYHLAMSPQGSARYQFSLKGVPSLRSRFISNNNVRSRVLILFVESLLETLVDHSSLNGSLVLLPEQIVLPQYRRDECLAAFENSVHYFLQRRQTEQDLANTLMRVAKTVRSSSKHATLNHTEPLERIPQFPFATAGVEKSQCILQLYRKDMLLSQACRNHLDMTAKKMNELEFVLDTPIATMFVWFYIIITIIVLNDLQSRLGKSENNKQRERRYLVQTLQDPVLRKAMEVDAIRDRGEEATTKMMERLDARAARYMLEAQADDEWKKQEFRISAWKTRLQRLMWYRFLFTIMCLLSLLLFFVDEAKAGRVLDGLLVATSGFLATYFCLPRSPLREGKKAKQLEKLLLPNLA